MHVDIPIVLACSLYKYKPCYSVVYIGNINTATNLVFNNTGITLLQMSCIETIFNTCRSVAIIDQNQKNI